VVRIMRVMPMMWIVMRIMIAHILNLIGWYGATRVGCYSAARDCCAAD
jgi:hypothetical protein